MKNSRKYLFLVLKILAVLIIVLIVGVFAYVSINKKTIISQVTREIETKLNGKLSVGKVELSFLRNFPSISVLLNNVTLTDTMFSQHKHTFFKGKEIFVSLAVSKLIKKEPPLKGLRIDDGEIYLYTDTSGYTNTYLMRGKKDSVKSVAKNSNIELKKIVLNNVRIIINDLKREKLHDFVVKNIKIDVDDNDNATSFNSKAEILIKSLAFNTRRGSFLKEKVFSGNFEMQMDKLRKQLVFNKIPVKISGQPFNITGFFDFSGISPQFSLNIISNKIAYPFVRTLVPEKISNSLAIVGLSKPLNVTASIKGPLKGGEPLVYITWMTENTQLITPFLDFEKATFKGFFSNEVVPGFPRKDPNSKIEINNFTATWHDLPITSKKIEILNLTEPELSCDMSSAFDLIKLNELVGSNSLKLREGTGEIRLNYKGPIVKNDKTNSFLNGEVSFKNGNILYATRDVEMKNVNGMIVFRNSDVFVENLSTSVKGQNITMQGQAKNLLTLINTQPDKANIDWNIYSPSLDLGAFTYLLDSKKKINKSSRSKGMNAATAKIDELLEQGRLHVNVKADRLHYKNFDASNTVADITLLSDRYLINNVSMEHAGGRMNLNGSLVNVVGNAHNARLLVNMDNVDVSRVFKAFDNFGQDGITGQNLDGKLTSKINAAMTIDSKGKVLPSSITSIIDFSLKNGVLNNYEPLKKLQRFVFKNRDFENIRFAELKNRLEVKDREIKINRMEIQSTVLSMFVEGVYSQKGGTDMSIQVPLNNLKKRAADFNPENIGADKKGGRSIYIRGRPGADGNVAFKLDLFNKFDKEKEKVN
ncbi:MAG: AsmA-like C-terminal region-containing protein [Ferruginibacter sp.]